jgi:pimeloyl-ACP methyl ester carboxylesterase
VRRLALIDHGPDVAERLRSRLAASDRTYAPPPPTDLALTLPEPVLSTLPSAAEQWAMVERIACPTLLVHAAQSDRFGADTAAHMARLLPDCRLVTIPDSGHGVLRDNPAALIAAVTEFFSETNSR